MIVRQCFLQTWQQPATNQCARNYRPLSARARIIAQTPVHQQRSRFHTTPSHRQGNGTHYDTLQLPTNSTDKEIKKQFYALSKTYHPDLHPNDPNASKRFVEISEAYATLGSAEKRTKYDREVLRTQQASDGGGPSGPGSPRGSYSSASGSGPGGRPASGLSRRRTQYRGPPPSFYRSGGWGRHGSKRQAESEKSSHTNEAQGRAGSNPEGPGEKTGSGGSGAAGTGPGGFQQGFDNDVPHFDHEGHFQTQSTIERMRDRARSRRTVRRDEDFEYESGTSNSAAFNFVLLLGVLGVIWGVSGVVFGFEKRGKGKSKKEEDEK